MNSLLPLIAKLEAMAQPQWREGLSRQLADKTLTLIRAGFDLQSNPFGLRWAPTKQPNPILNKTGRMRNSYRVFYVDSEFFTVGTDVEYAHFHQDGTKHLPPRTMVPLYGSIPSAWSDAYTSIVNSYVKASL